MLNQLTYSYETIITIAITSLDLIQLKPLIIYNNI